MTRSPIAGGLRAGLAALGAASAIAFAAGPAPAKPQPPPSPAAAKARAFVEGLYERVIHDDHFCATCEDAAPSIFDASANALLAEDARLTPAGDVGAIDADPLCQCQDTGGLKATVTAVRLTSKTTATAAVSLDFTEAQPVVHDRVTLLLVLVGGRWRIHDILDAGGSSFRQMLADENAERRQAGR